MSAWCCIDIVRRHSVLVTHGSYGVIEISILILYGTKHWFLDHFVQAINFHMYKWFNCTPKDMGLNSMIHLAGPEGKHFFLPSGWLVNVCFDVICSSKCTVFTGFALGKLWASGTIHCVWRKLSTCIFAPKGNYWV